MGSKNKKFSINLPIDIYDKVCESSENNNFYYPANNHPMGENKWKREPKKYQITDNQAIINQLKEHNRTL